MVKFIFKDVLHLFNEIGHAENMVLKIKSISNCMLDLVGHLIKN